MRGGRRAIAAVSVDVDPLSCYFEIHGLGRSPDELEDAVFTRAVPRLVELFDQHRIPATFFLVGRSLEASDAERCVRALAGRGFELGNHSYSHPYGLLRLPPGPLAEEIDRAHARIVTVAGP